MHDRFLDEIADVLEIDGVSLETRFREVPDWSSLKGFGILVVLENSWGTRLDIEKFIALETVRDLYRETFKTFAANLLGVGRDALSGDSAYGAFQEWDSIKHLRMIMEAEEKFGVKYRLEDMPSILSIDDFIEKAQRQ